MNVKHGLMLTLRSQTYKIVQIGINPVKFAVILQQA